MNSLDPKKLALIAFALPLTLAVAAPGIADPEDSDPASESSRLRETAEDVDTLRLLLTRELRTDAAQSDAAQRYRRDPESANKPPRFDPKQDSEQRKDPGVVDLTTRNDFMYLGDLSVYSVYGGATDSTSFTRGFYAPGVGAWIDTTIRVPLVNVAVASAKPDPEADRDAARDDWDSARRELHTQPAQDESGNFVGFRVRVPVSTRLELDKARIDRAVDTAIELLGRHGHRLRHVPGDESVVIAFKVESIGAGASELYLSSLRQWRGALGASSPGNVEQSVVVRVAKKTLDAYAAGDLDAEALRKRIDVTRY
jgi:hypothetical protein